MSNILEVVRDRSADDELALLLQHRPSLISGMFDSIAYRYDGLDHLLSAGLDDHWRAALVQDLGLVGGEAVLDLCSGTGRSSPGMSDPVVPWAGGQRQLAIEITITKITGRRIQRYPERF